MPWILAFHIRFVTLRFELGTCLNGYLSCCYLDWNDCGAGRRLEGVAIIVVADVSWVVLCEVDDSSNGSQATSKSEASNVGISSLAGDDELTWPYYMGEPQPLRR